MKYKTNPWPIILAVVITATVTGGGMYLWQTQNSTTATPKEKEKVTNVSPPITEPTTVSEKIPTAQSKLSLKGIIHYRVDGSAWLEIDDFTRYEIQMQDTTILKGIADNSLDEKIKKIMKEDDQNYPWFGLMSSISPYIKEGSVVQIEGTTNNVIANEISVLE